MRSTMAILVLILLGGCQKYHENNQFDHFLESTGLPVDFSKRNIIIFLPMDGCSGCQSSLIDFIKANFQDHQNLFCVISTSRKKELKSMLGNITNSRLFVDSDLAARKSGIITYYPVIYYLNDHEFESVEIKAENIDDQLSILSSKL